jgi:hypothetical protein
LRVCTKCGAEKPVADFHKGNKGRGLQGKCKECQKAERREWYLKPSSKEYMAAYGRLSRSKDYRRDYALKRKFGISLADYDRMHAEQDGRCANPGCRTDRPGKTRPRFDVDHDHSTGKVRGLLCVSCNLAIGLLGEDLQRLLGAIAYLESHR